MTNQHLITPPPELVQQWINEEDGLTAGHIATQAARWGADQELEACVEWLEDADLDDSQKVSWVNLRNARRPKPPSLKEEALEALEEIGQVGSALVRSRSDTIRRALEALPND